MNNRLKILLAIACVLVVANALKITVFTGKEKSSARDSYEKYFKINHQKNAPSYKAKVVRGLFNGPAAGRFEFKKTTANNKAKIPIQKEIKWPDFKITGIAENEGNKCAFFSGRDYNGMVYEGGEFYEKYRVELITDDSVKIIDMENNITKKYFLEGR